MFDLLVAEFKDKIVSDCNTSGLPVTAIAYVLQDVAQQVASRVQQQVQTQKIERDKQTAAAETKN